MSSFRLGGVTCWFLSRLRYYSNIYSQPEQLCALNVDPRDKCMSCMCVCGYTVLFADRILHVYYFAPAKCRANSIAKTKQVFENYSTLSLSEPLTKLSSQVATAVIPIIMMALAKNARCFFDCQGFPLASAPQSGRS